jgi:regulator of protease activity HflC (stomatin/prohibitin superfamily)
MKFNKFTIRPPGLILIALILLVLFNPFVIIPAGERGVLLKFGAVQQKILGEGLQVITPLINSVKKLSVRIESQEISAEASSKDLQEVFADVALNWHLIPEEVNNLYQKIGREQDVVEKIINPAVEEVLKAVIAKYTAEEVITKRGEVKTAVDDLLTARLVNYYLKVDDISLVHVHFSQRFTDAVEAKQIAEQDAKKAGFAVLKATKEAEAKVSRAKGEAQAQEIIHATLTPDILQKEAITKWDGKLPIMMDKNDIKLFDLTKLRNQ